MMVTSHLTVFVLYLMSITIDIGLALHSPCGQLKYQPPPQMTRSERLTYNWPWHAAIYHQMNEESPSTYKCGGTVISSFSILTAAHCVSHRSVPLDVRFVSVSVGRLNLNETEITSQSFGVTFDLSFG